MDFYGLPSYKNSSLISQFYVQNDGWKTDRIEEIVHSLKDRSFFCRFSKQHIKHFMKFMRCKRFKKDEVIFVDTEVQILLDGLVYMKSHTEDVTSPKILAKLQQGDIIGCTSLDNGIS